MSESKLFDVIYQELLKDLKSTVEGLLVSQVANVWNVYGGLNRLHSAMDKIFKHGFKGEADVITFINGLNWLQPNVENSSSVNTDSEYQSYVPVHLKNSRSSIWLYRSIESHSLSRKLSWLLSDKKHLLTCYDESAFLCQEKYAEATLICLRAVERYQPSLLSEINPCLVFIRSEFTGGDNKTHRRSSSFPYFGMSHEWTASEPKVERDRPTENIKTVSENRSEERKQSAANLSASMFDIESEKFAIDVSKRVPLGKSDAAKHVGKLKPWSSLTNLKIEESVVPKRERSATMGRFSTRPNTPLRTLGCHAEHKLSPSFLEVDYLKLQADLSHDFTKNPAAVSSPALERVGSDGPSGHGKSKPLDVETPMSKTRTSEDGFHTPRKVGSSREIENKISKPMSIRSMPIKKSPKFGFFSGSSPEYSFMPSITLAGERDPTRCPKQSFIETGGSGVAPMATGYFPKPAEGQSLISFLSSGNFSRTNAELDRENAHFNISEALISAIEQLKFNRRIKIEKQRADDSDDEINDLRRRIRTRRKQKRDERKKLWDGASKSPINSSDVTSNENITTSLSTSPESLNDSASTDGGSDDLDVDSASYLADSRSLSVSLASVYSENDVLRNPREAPDGQSDVFTSAESVALSLISKFNKRHLPKASELEWLVSENDAPQALLPLPLSWPIGPDAEDVYSSSPDRNTSLRGTFDWAPPRPQIIFTMHPSPVRTILLAKQNYRCAGCGMRVATQYASRFRYCDYLGRYFCTGCHSNQLSLIPGRILSKWNFKRYPVSSFSYKLLDQLSTDPLFNVTDINPYLYRKSKELNKCRLLRTQLYYMKDFIMSCRFAQKIQESLHKEQKHLYNEYDVYSVYDLITVKKGDMQSKLLRLLDMCLSHIMDCQLCQARGFICEICSHKDVIFPWQLNKVSRCSLCATCYHKECWSSASVSPCCKCLRIKHRRESLAAI